jgi:hypothetical protein
MQEQGGNGATHRIRAACQDFDAQLSDYLEGADRPAVVSHAAECEFCGPILTDFLLVRSATGELADLEPPGRVWANVRATLVAEGLIREPRRIPPWRQWLLRPVPAAALAGLLLLSMFSVRAWVRQSQRARKTVTEVANIIDPNLIRNVSQMELAFRARSGSLNPAVKRAYEQDLDSLNGEIKECNDTLAQQPDDGFSREYLTTAYTEKARVLESALELGDNDR